MFDFWIILCACLVAFNGALLGSFLMLKKMSMIGDALSHSVLPGIVIAFLITQEHSSFLGLLLAAGFGLVAVFIMNALSKPGGFQKDAAIGISYTALFSIGIILISSYAKNADIDVECVLFGDIGTVPYSKKISIGTWEIPQPISLLAGFTIINALIILKGIKGFSISSFDPLLATSLGVSILIWDYLLLGLASVNTVFSFDAVGAIMVISTLVIPSGFAHLFCNRIKNFLGLACIFAITCSIAGYYISLVFNINIVAGISTLMGIVFIVALTSKNKFQLKQDNTKSQQ